MPDVLRLSATEFYMQGGQTVVTNETRHIRLNAGETSIPIYFGRTFDPQPYLYQNWLVYASFGVAGLGWSRIAVVDIDRPPLPTGV